LILANKALEEKEAEEAPSAHDHLSDYINWDLLNVEHDEAWNDFDLLMGKCNC